MSDDHPDQGESQAGTNALDKEVIVETYRASGPGGQRRDKKDTAVRITHVPTGITVVASERRSQALNREIAFQRLREKLQEMARPERPRIETEPPPAAKIKRLKAKRRRAQRKLERGTPEPVDDDGH